MTTISEPDTMALAVTGVTKHYDSGFVLEDRKSTRLNSSH